MTFLNKNKYSRGVYLKYIATASLILVQCCCASMDTEEKFENVARQWGWKGIFSNVLRGNSRARFINGSSKASPWTYNIDVKRSVACGRPGSYSEELEEKFEKAVWDVLSKDYKISFDDFKASLRSALKPQDRLYTAPLLMHFTNYLVPKYEFHYKTADDRMKNIPYKTLKFPSEFEVAIGVPNVGKVVYEAKE